jgi:hypothetical protein
MQCHITGKAKHPQFAKDEDNILFATTTLMPCTHSQETLRQ